MQLKATLFINKVQYALSTHRRQLMLFEGCLKHQLGVFGGHLDFPNSPRKLDKQPHHLLMKQL